VDIVRAGRDEALLAHFVGSIVYVEKGLYSVSSQSPLLVIVGQQRLTTVTTFVEALARALGDAEPVPGFDVTGFSAPTGLTVGIGDDRVGVLVQTNG
jgi:hypothetical protein